MAYFNPKDYFPTLREWIRYGCDISWDDYSVMKNPWRLYSADVHVFCFQGARHL